MTFSLEISLEFIFKDPCNWEKSCRMHLPFVMSNTSYWVIISMKFSLTEIQYSFQVIKRFYIKKFRKNSKSLALDMHFSLVKSLYKNQVIWDYMTKKSPDFSQKVWLLVERNGGYKWLLFFCLVSDHVKTSSQR